MSVRKYEVFLRVVELGSLTKAAEQLGLTQSGVSHLINALEEEFGFPLLRRSRAGVSLTADGERVLPAMRNILNGSEQLSQIIGAVKGLSSGTVRIGAFTSVAVHWLPGIIKEFTGEHPGIEIKLLNGDYHDVAQWLLNGEADLGFVAYPEELPFRCIPLREDRLMAVLPRNHPMAGRRSFPIEEMTREPMISLLTASDHDARRALEQAGVVPHIKYYTKDDYAMIAMVENGLGAAIVPELLLKGHSERVAALPLEPSAKRTISLALGEPGAESPATEAFARCAVEWIKKNGGV